MKVSPITSRIPFLNSKKEVKIESEFDKAQQKMEKERAERNKEWQKLINKPQKFKGEKIDEKHRTA